MMELSGEDYLESQILIVDDEPANIRLLERVLQREGFRNIESTTEPRQFLALYTARRPDILLLDLHMPGLDGFGVMEQLKGRISPGEFVPIVVLTADITPQARQRALSAGAKDFLTKPVDPTEVILRIKNLLQTRFFYQRLQGQNEDLEEKVAERTRELEKAQIEILERLAKAAGLETTGTPQPKRVFEALKGDAREKMAKYGKIDGKSWLWDADAIREAAAMDETAYASYRRSAHQLARDRILESQIVDEVRDLFITAAEKS